MGQSSNSGLFVLYNHSKSKHSILKQDIFHCRIIFYVTVNLVMHTFNIYRPLALCYY